MFERYLTDVLTTHFGHVVENLDADKVRLSAWNGELVLQDLTLRPGALNTFIRDCPVEIAYGKVGNLELRLPWKIFGSGGGGSSPSSSFSLERKGLFTKGCTVVLSDVNILITPRKETKTPKSSDLYDSNDADLAYSEDAVESRRVQKEKRVQTLLDADLLKRVTSSSGASTTQWKWVQDWLTSLLSTLSVTVRNIHIRYEDPGTSMGFEWNYSSVTAETKESSPRHYRPPFAVGIDLDQFSVQTTNPLKRDGPNRAFTTPRIEAREESEEKKGDGNMTTESQAPSSAVRQSRNDRFLTSRKTAAAYRLAIYWDSECNLMSIHARSNKGETVTRVELCQYYESAFRILNNDHSSDSCLHQSLYAVPHTYILDPISPSVVLSLVSKREEEIVLLQTNVAASENDDTTTDLIPIHSNSATAPPSVVAISLPPCKFTISRSMLEDTGYIRKSLSVWQQATKGLLSEGSLRRMARLRPVRPPLEDPKGWWLYAFEATLSLQRVSRDGRELDIEFERRRKRGWVGLAQALGRRRRYVKLYKRLVEGDENVQIESHTALVQMEDDLLAEEILAFRIAVYEWMKSKLLESTDAPPLSPTKSSRTWQGWVSRTQPIESDAKASLVADGNDVTIMTVRHRRRMVEEMSTAIEREKMNIQSRLSEGERFASLVDLDTFGSVEESSNHVVWEASLLCQDIAIQVNDQPSDTFHHVHHQGAATRSRRHTPVVRLSCAWVQEQSWYQDGSWDAECTLASLSVRDLTVTKAADGSVPGSRSLFPNLVGRKRGAVNAGENDVFHIDGERHHQSMTITIRRKLHWQLQKVEANYRGVDRGSTTKTQIRILPMEVVYATVPVEALTRVLATVKTPELADDYHRMASVVFEWRERQKNKFLSALAHKNKTIIVDVDVGAPNCLIPEDLSRRDSPMLVVDLGQLRIFKGDVSKQETMEFDDQWRVVLSNIQVQCTTISAYARMSAKAIDGGPVAARDEAVNASQQLVEPFSLDFTISTKVVSDAERGPTDKNRVQVLATLPRLAFNFSSSAIRLGRRMEHQWNKRKIELQASLTSQHPPGVFSTKLGSFQSPSRSPARTATAAEPSQPGRTRDTGARSTTARTMQFHFSAPLITFRLENDVDGRDCDILNLTRQASHRFVSSTPILDISFRDIQGKFVQEVSQNGVYTTLFDARLRSLGAVDLYQGAGKEYALLLSSVAPGLLTAQLPAGDECSWQALLEDGVEAQAFGERGTDLVTVQYTGKASQSFDLVSSENRPDKLSIRFHELYIEWNPETFAAIQKAVRIPRRLEGEFSSEVGAVEAEESSENSCDDFFDAMEDVFFDAGSETNSGVHLISEVSSAQNSFDSPLFSPATGEDHQPWNRNALNMSFSNSEPNSPSKFTSPLLFLHQAKVTSEKEAPIPRPYKPFEFIFKLSKLHVDFNKESRHRRILTAQMDGTTVRYETRPDGGSRTSTCIGNLVFTDPSHEDNQTLYAHILGLQSDGDSKFSARPSSLLEMEIFINPKTREFTTKLDIEKEPAYSNGVSIDCDKGVVRGCNTFIRATFSPMRFVFLEQLWIEFLDYFFEGIIGTEVWGGSGGSKVGQTVSVQPIERALLPRFSEMHLPGAAAEGVNFTRFVISIDSPVVLLPVTYRSTQFLRVAMTNISVCNHYNSSVVSENQPSLRDPETEERRQWYNNCEVMLKDLTIFSWCGRELGNKAVIATISAVWPVGPLAPLIVPKWRVACQMDSLDISLRRSDYAVLQNILSYNIGEASRHLDEWEALQTLSQSDVKQYKDKIMVHFGYDNKDVAPTTYKVTVSIPSVSFTLIDGDSAVEKPLAIARCMNLHWQLRKLADRTTRQLVSCDVEVVTPNTSAVYDRLLSLAKYDSEVLAENQSASQRNETAPGLKYSSQTDASGDQIKTLEICDACIYIVVAAWKRFASFFQSLPEPHILTVEDVGGSIQVGDRWYRIGGSSDIRIKKPENVGVTNRRLSWIESSLPLRNGPLKRLRSHGSINLSSPSFQLRVLLSSPRIILSSKPVENESVTRLILRMQHLDYLHTNDGKLRTVTRHFFFHDVEVYSTSAKKGTQNSLIHPWCAAGTMERCNGTLGACSRHSIRISADVLHARAAYSDMLIAIEVSMTVFHDARSSGSSQSEGNATSPSFSALSYGKGNNADSEGVSPPDDVLACQHPQKSLFDIECDGFELLVVDDSGRHFAGAQEMIILSLGKCVYSFEQCRSKFGLPTTNMNLKVHSLDLFDCLQLVNSPFRLAASSRSGAMGLQAVRHSMPISEGSPSMTAEAQKRRMDWPDVTMVKNEGWGYSASPTLLNRTRTRNSEMLKISQSRTGMELGLEEEVIPELIEVHSFTTGGVSREYRLKLRSLAVQWNPSTIIAIQRFLGRILKESKARLVRVLDQEIDDLISTPSLEESFGEKIVIDGQAEGENNISVHAVIDLGRLTVCLNKEHQNRRLVEATLSGCRVDLESSDLGLRVDGHLGDFNAWDSDNYEDASTGEVFILRQNRNILRVASLRPETSRTTILAKESPCDQPFLEVHYKTFKSKEQKASLLHGKVPPWVQSQVSVCDGIDDFLSLSVASLHVTYLRERTDEILDYLSNGLPGKGMGVTSRAAKGFLKKRILTKSFLELHVNSPQVFVPQHEVSEDGIALKLGKLYCVQKYPGDSLCS
jgi:hypothetical protein